MGPTALLHLRRKAGWGFCSPKIRRLRPGGNPRTWVPKASTEAAAAFCKMNHARRQEVNVFAWLILLDEYVLTACDTVLCTAWSTMQFVSTSTMQFVSTSKIGRVPSWTNLIYIGSQARDVDPLTNNVYWEGIEFLNTVRAVVIIVLFVGLWFWNDSKFERRYVAGLSQQFQPSGADNVIMRVDHCFVQSERWRCQDSSAYIAAAIIWRRWTIRFVSLALMVVILNGGDL
jgi:hypothetical protein